MAWRSAAVAMWSLAVLALRLALPPLRLLAPRAAERLHAGSTRLWARGTARLIGMRVTVVGAPPEPPFLLVANHVSYTDIPALWHAVEGDFLAKREIASWPLIGPVARFAGTRFVDRTRAADLPRVLDELEGLLGARRGVILFPEGTSSDGSDVLPFRPPLFEAAVRAGHPVYCAAISYATPPGEEPARTSVCWWGDEPFLSHIPRLLRLRSFEARVELLAGPVPGATRKELAANAQARVETAFRPVTGATPLEAAQDRTEVGRRAWARKS